MEVDEINLKRIYFPHIVLRDARKAKEMTQQQTADGCGVTLRQYQRLETGERDIAATSFKVALTLCDLLDIEPHNLLNGITEK